MMQLYMNFNVRNLATVTQVNFPTQQGNTD